MLTYKKIEYEVGKYVEFFSGYAYYGKIKLFVCYDCKIPELIVHGIYRIPESEQTPVVDELYTYFENLTEQERMKRRSVSHV